MADPSLALSAFIENNLIYIILIFGIGIGGVFLYKMIRGIPKQTDFIKVFQEKTISDEAMNKTDKKFGIKSLWRGHQYIGRILTYSDTFQKIQTKTEAKEDNRGWKDKKPPEKIIVHTITFKTPSFRILGFKFFGFKKEILKFTDKDRYKVEEKGKLVFPSDVAFTALGYEYATVNSYPLLTRLIDDNWNKRLLEANVNLMASRMSQMSAESPEMAHELSLKRLEIERIKAEKQLKTGSII